MIFFSFSLSCLLVIPEMYFQWMTLLICGPMICPIDSSSDICSWSKFLAVQSTWLLVLEKQKSNIDMTVTMTKRKMIFKPKLSIHLVWQGHHQLSPESILTNHAYSCLGFRKLFNVLLSRIGRKASWPIRNIETFPSRRSIFISHK